MTKGNSELETPIEGLLSTPTSRLPYQHNVLLRSYILERPQGNVIVYNSPGISEAATTIGALGAPVRLLINHSHESMYGQPDLDVPLWAHTKDEAEIAASLDLSGSFDRRGMIDDDLEVIPTPGHTAGTTSYLWDNGSYRFLFTGDFIWIENGEWRAVVLSPELRRDYLESLALVRELQFDVLVPWGTTEEGLPIGRIANQAEVHERIDAMSARIEAGARH